ncbi:MAG: hypothetical protein U0794_14225 [Isosphaeraceae bacterium]
MPRVLSVGQCGYDHGSISTQLRRWASAEVVAAPTFKKALEALRDAPFDLLLVNRVTDADGTRGLDLIRQLKADPDLAQVPVMLVSDYAEAQQEAQANGALAGFGKSSLHAEETRQRVLDALNVSKA